MAVAKIPGRRGRGARRSRAILSRDRTEDDEKFCTAMPIYVYNLWCVCVCVCARKEEIERDFTRP